MTDYSAKHWAEKARKQASGTMVECPDGSAKHWAQVAEATASLIGDPANRDLSNLTDEGLSRLSNLPLFLSFKTGHILNNASYVNGRLFSWLSGAVYTSAYQELVKEMTGSTTGQITSQTLYAWASDDDYVIYTETMAPTSDADLRNADGTAYVFDSTTYPKYFIDGGVVEGYLNAKFEGLGEGLGLVRTQAKDITIIETIAEQKTQTIAGVTITYYLTGTNKKICLPDQADNVAALYTATGAADFYLLDTENQQFKLPRRNARRLLQAYKSSTDWYNLYSDGWVEQGGTSLIRINENVVFPLSFVNTDYTLTALPIEMNPNVGSNDISYKTKSNASIRLILRFNGAAQSGFNCMWQASGYAETSLIQDEFEYEYFFVGNTVQNQTSIDVGQITQTLTGKADVDLSNAVPAKSFTSQSAAWAMPSNEYLNLTIEAGSEYTCPANGYFCVSKTSNASNQYFFLKNNTTGIKVGEFASNWSGQNISLFVPAKQGDVCYWGGTFGGSTIYARFYYAEGAI